VVAALLVLAALALMVSALGVGAGGLPWGDPGERADGHPQRVERPYVVRELPARPGPLAGLVSDGGPWLAVSPHGRLWRLADEDEGGDVEPALSADGRVLAYLRESENGFGEYVLRDLVTGELTAFPGLSSSDPGTTAAYWVAPQHPAFVSPGGDRVLVKGERTGDNRSPDGLVVGADGVREMYVRGVAWPAGWSPDGERIAWLVTPTVMEPTDTVELVATSSTGEELGRREVALPHPMSLSQWSPVLSPDGSRVALVGDSGGWVVVSVATGEQSGSGGATTDTGCPPSWRRGQLLHTDDGALRDRRGRPVVVADPSVTFDCSMWAADALAGSEHPGLTGRVFGTDTGWATWRWREHAAGGLLLLAALVYALGVLGAPANTAPARAEPATGGSG